MVNKAFLYETSSRKIKSHVMESQIILLRDQNNRFSKARQNVRYYQIFTGHFKNPSDIMKLTPIA